MALNLRRNVWILAGLLAALPLRGQNTLSVSCPGQAPSGITVDCTMMLSLGAGASVDGLLFGVQVTPNNGAPALTQGQLSFSALVAGSFATTGNTNNQISVMWFNLSHALSGQADLGTVGLVLPSNASVGQTYAVTVTGGSASLGNNPVSLTMGPPAAIAIGVASLTSVTPNVGEAGTAVANIAITGLQSGFVQGTTVASFGPGVTVDSLTIHSPTSATASVSVAAGATPGARDVSLTTGTEVASLSAGFTILAGPSLSIVKSHTGKFSQRQNGATYSVTVSNAAGSGPTSGTLTLAESLPVGMTLQAMSGGSTWNCSVQTASCTTNTVLAGGSNYPAIVVTVNLAKDAAASLTNQVSLSAGGSVIAGASDPTVVTSLCDANQDGSTTVTDVQRVINQALGNSAPANDLNNDGAVNVVDIQRVANAALGWTCAVS